MQKQVLTEFGGWPSAALASALSAHAPTCGSPLLLIAVVHRRGAEKSSQQQQAQQPVSEQMHGSAQSLRHTTVSQSAPQVSMAPSPSAGKPAAYNPFLQPDTGMRHAGPVASSAAQSHGNFPPPPPLPASVSPASFAQGLKELSSLLPPSGMGGLGTSSATTFTLPSIPAHAQHVRSSHSSVAGSQHGGNFPPPPPLHAAGNFGVHAAQHGPPPHGHRGIPHAQLNQPWQAPPFGSFPPPPPLHGRNWQ